MPSIRLVMENFINKKYPDKKLSYNGDMARVRVWTPKRIHHPLYYIYLTEKEIICLVGIEPDIIMFLCPDSLSKIQDFERSIKTSLQWIMDSDGNIIGKDQSDKHRYKIEYIITGNYNVEHVDKNPLNNKLDNLISIGEKK